MSDENEVHGTRVPKPNRDFVESIIGGPPFEIGDYVMDPKGEKLVQIVGGQYWGTHGLSNAWTWKTVREDGTLSKKPEYGYGWTPSKNFGKTMPDWEEVHPSSEMKM